MTAQNVVAVEPLERLSFQDRIRKRVLLIGPVLPYRGGIAQHTTMLHRALSQQSECLTISFTRQYPSFLFPGKSDRDENLTNHIEDNVEYLIDSVNPLSWLQAVKRAKSFAPNLIIFPWWHVYWVPCFLYLCKKLKEDHIEIVFLCHNVVEHENARWKTMLSACVLSKADRFVVHTNFDKASILTRFSDRPIDIHPLPVFNHFPESTLRFLRRGKLELLFFGFVRPYKGLEILLEAMTLLKEEDVYLSIVGEFWGGEKRTLTFISDHGLSKKVECISRYVSDQEAAAFFSRCDIVVLPYHSATGSAIISLAYRYGKPVIATRVGGLPDMVEDGVTGTLIKPGSSTELAEEIKNAIAGVKHYNHGAIISYKNQLTWEGLAKVALGGSL